MPPRPRPAFSISSVRFARTVAGLILVGGGAASLTAAPLQAQAATSGAAPATAEGGVAVEPLMNDLRVLASDAMAGRGVGTEGGRRARDYIVERLAAMGFHPVADTFEVRRRDGVAEGVNVRVQIPGSTHPDRYIVVSAHYDHLGTREGTIYNGADDNASGTAAVLALAAWLGEHPPHHTVTLLFADAEEGGLQGARHFVAHPPMDPDRIVLNVNLDMVARSDAELWVSGTHPWPLLRPLVESVEAAPPVRLRLGHDTPADQGADNWVMASDHGAFHEQGIPFLYFGVADHADYHRPTDDAELVDPVFFRAAAETVRRVVQAADASLEGRRPAG